MIGWIKQLFSSFDRQQSAAERAAVALEGIATDLEAMHATLRERLGHQDVTVTPSVIEDHSNGKRRVRV